MIRKHNTYQRPRKPFEAMRIKEENELRKKYGLKNKLEIWKTLAKVNYFRSRAKVLAKSSPEEQEMFFVKLREIGLNVKNIADVLDLKVEDLLERRLPSVLVKRELAPTMKGARQMIVHKRVKIHGSTIDAPSYLVLVSDEHAINIKAMKSRAVPAAAESSNVEEVENVEDSDERAEDAK